MKLMTMTIRVGETVPLEPYGGDKFSNVKPEIELTVALEDGDDRAECATKVAERARAMLQALKEAQVSDALGSQRGNKVSHNGTVPQGQGGNTQGGWGAQPQVSFPLTGRPEHPGPHTAGIAAGQGVSPQGPQNMGASVGLAGYDPQGGHPNVQGGSWGAVSSPQPSQAPQGIPRVDPQTF